MLLRHVAVLSSVAAVLVAGGCGSSKKSSGTTSSSPPVATGTSVSSQSTATTPSPTATGPRLSQASFIAKADPICQRINLQRAATHLNSKAAYVTLLPPLATAEQAAASELRQIAPPAALAGDWAKIVNDAEAIAKATSKYSEYAAAGNIASTKTVVSTANAAQRNMRALGMQIGFKSCGQNPS